MAAAMNPIGQLLAADEGLCHQIADTFAVAASSDLSWTEKVCAMAMARDGSLQIGFGLGKYNNRNVMDAYAGISRGVEQITVRASRRLSPSPETTVVGPIRYEVLEPLRSVRFVLEPNDVQPIAFDVTFTSVVPPFLEDRTHMRQDYRVASDLVRYHQSGVATGWIEVDGERTTVDPDRWVSTRDHSWGVRLPMVGRPITDLEPADALAGMTFEMIWSPIPMQRQDGTWYALMLHHQTMEAPGFLHKRVMGGVEHADGRMDRWVDLVPDLQFDPRNRRLLGGVIRATTADGTERALQIEVLDDTGFHLGAGLYFGFDDHFHGEWRGAEHTDGERIADCSEPDQARRLHQIRDTCIRVTDPVGGGIGWGNCQPMITGASSRHGLDAADSFW
jgi:hypothetical protein